MRSSKLSALLILSMITGQIPLSAFGAPPTSPDDYDVVKYQRLSDAAAYTAADEDRKLTALTGLATRARDALQIRQAKLNDLNTKLSSAQSELAGLQRTDTDLENESTRLAASLSQIQGQLNQATTDQRNAQAALAQIQGELDAANRSVATEQAAYDAKNGQLTPVENQLRAKQGELDTAKSNASAARSRISSATSEKNGLEPKLSQLRARESALGGEIAKAQAELNAATADQAKAQADVNSTGIALRDAKLALAAGQKGSRPPDEIARLQAAVNTAETAAQAARLAFAEATKRKTDSATAVSAGQNELNTVRSEIPQTVIRIADLTSQISRDTQTAATLDSQISSLTSEVASLRSQSDSLRAEVARLLAALNTAKAATADVRNRAATLQANVNSANQRVSTAQSQLNSAQSQITQNRAKIDQNKARINTLQAQIPSLQRDRDTTAAGIDTDTRASRDADAAVTDQRTHVRDAQVVAQNARARLNQVETNYQNGMAQATRDGQHDGREAAGREGTDAGTQAGNRDGAIAGGREGTDAGRVEGSRVAVANGTRDGQVRGNTDGATKGTQEGNAQGAAEGVRVGHSDGIAQGQSQGTNKGENEGLAAGTAAGHADGSYDRGYAEGAKTGKARGNSEGSVKGREDGTKLADKEALGAKLNNVTIPMGAPLASLGFVESISHAFAPHYPIPEMDRAYDAAYRDIYQQVYDGQYKTAAAASYDRAYRQTYQGAYDRAVRADYTADYNSAYQNAYATAEDSAYRRALDSSYKTAYASAYQTEYQRVFSGTYNTAYQAAYKAAFDSGRATSNAADLDRGRKEGVAKGYSTAYAASYASAKSASYATEKAIYDNSAILQMQSAASVDENHDNVNVPGEAVLLNISVKNFGRIASGGNIQVELSTPTSGLEVLRPTTVLPVLPAVSHILLTGLNALRVRPQASIGAKESVVVTLTAGGQVLGSSKVDLTVGRTLSLSAVEVPTKVLPNVENTIRIVVKNSSAKPALGEATVTIVSDDGNAVVSVGTISLGVLKGAEAKEVKTTFRYNDAPAPDKVGLHVEVRVADALYDSKALNVKSAERYAFNASSKGLLVVNTTDATSLAQQARKAAAIGFDLYDERQEGAMNSTTAGHYVAKLLVIPEAVGLKTATLTSLKGAINHGAPILIGLDAKSSSTDIGAAAITLAKKNPTRDLLGVKLSERNAFKTSAPANKVILVNPASQIGVDGLANALLIADAIVKTTSDQTKSLLTATSTRDTRGSGILRTVLLSELTQEMLDDVIVNGKNFEKNVSKLKLTQVTTILAGATPADRAVLGSLYRELEATRAALTGSASRRDAITQLLAPLLAASQGH
jgi:predicted  nucleic acid-binding Zn-ribbon protein